MTAVKVVSVFLILGLGLFVALSPTIVYAPTPKIVLFFLISFLPSLLFGAAASSRFKLELPGFVFTTAGACAVCLGTLLLLNHLSKPEEKIAVYQVYDENKEPVSLDWQGAFEVMVTAQGLSVTKFIEGHTAVLIFPEQVGSVEVRIKKAPIGPTYVGTVGYAGNRTSNLVLGQQLSLTQP